MPLFERIERAARFCGRSRAAPTPNPTFEPKVSDLTLFGRKR